MQSIGTIKDVVETTDSRGFHSSGVIDKYVLRLYKNDFSLDSKLQISFSSESGDQC
jgi:hypothetical protein